MNNIINYSENMMKTKHQYCKCSEIKMLLGNQTNTQVYLVFNVHVSLVSVFLSLGFLFDSILLLTVLLSSQQ